MTKSNTEAVTNAAAVVAAKLLGQATEEDVRSVEETLREYFPDVAQANDMSHITNGAASQREAALELAAEFGIHLIDGGDRGDTYEFSEDALISFVDTLRTEVASELCDATPSEVAPALIYQIQVKIDGKSTLWFDVGLEEWDRQNPNYYDKRAVYIAPVALTAETVTAARTYNDFYAGICVSLQAVTAADNGVLWREIVNTCEVDGLLNYAARVEPEEWAMAGFAKYAESELGKGNPTALAATAPSDAEKELPTLPKLNAGEEFVCDSGCGTTTPELRDFELSREELPIGQVISRTEKVWRSGCCGACVIVYGNLDDSWTEFDDYIAAHAKANS